MANPTTNFGWVMPTSTDLVTDLPADFAVFGQGVDTTMAELKGGTTGQVLSKTSNTDMDFTWVAQDDSNAIQNSQLTAKGALITAFSAGTPATLTVGSNGETLVVDSSTATGLRYRSAAYSAKTAAYTFASGDDGKIFSMNNAATQQFNIPTDATFDFPIGTEITVFWITGAGQPTIGAVTPGTTTLISTGATSATPKLRVANSGATAKKLAANSWIVFGDIS